MHYFLFIFFNLTTIGTGGGFVIVNIISVFKVDALRNKLFTLEKSLIKEDLANLITLPLTKLNFNYFFHFNSHS